MKVGDLVNHYDINHDVFRPGTVVHVHADDVALILLDKRRRDGGNWYAIQLLDPPKYVPSEVDG